jgi:hypothetical protein
MPMSQVPSFAASNTEEESFVWISISTFGIKRQVSFLELFHVPEILEEEPSITIFPESLVGS